MKTPVDPKKLKAAVPPGKGTGKPWSSQNKGKPAKAAKPKGPQPQWAGIANQMLGKC